LAGDCARRQVDGALVIAAVEINDLDLPPSGELHVVTYAVAVVLLHCLSLASSTRCLALFSYCGEIAHVSDPSRTGCLRGVR
jgi:hypothetical protein